jgi:hypothetical protein
MYLLYLDESGNEDDPADRYFVLAGAAVFERQTYYLSQGLEQIQVKHFPGHPPIEFHASPIRKGKDFCRNIEASKREAILQDLADCIRNSQPEGVVLFGAAIEKSAQLWGEKAVEYATEEICQRFDLFLARRYFENDPQRGLLVFSEGRFTKRAKVWVRGFRELGTRWGTLKNLSDIPYFASTKESRLLQIADIIAHAVFLLYERQDASLVRNFIHRFDRKDGVLHGLVHHKRVKSATCSCPACASRSNPNSYGPLIPS